MQYRTPYSVYEYQGAALSGAVGLRNEAAVSISLVPGLRFEEGVATPKPKVDQPMKLDDYHVRAGMGSLVAR